MRSHPDRAIGPSARYASDDSSFIAASEIFADGGLAQI
jgi:hypothetical protein